MHKERMVAVVAAMLIVFGLQGVAAAVDPIPSSTNYNLPESYVGPGGGLDGTSTNYQLQSTIGDTGIGNSGSTNYGLQSGSNTTNDPRLTLIINSSNANFGAFSTSVTKTATTTFSVLNYTSYGYAVYTIGTPPSNGSHTLTNISSTDTSHVGTEQYGINLKSNTSPISFGADPVQVPDSSFSSGAATSGYDTANNFRYVNGEQIAGANKTSGETDYTISYIVNASTMTPAGEYSGSQSLVAVGTY